MRDLFHITVSSLILTPLILAGVSISFAQVMQSGSYKIQSDSLNFGGGLGTSSSYTLESTGGEVGTGESTSSNYALRAGYQQMQEVYISLSGFASVTLTPSIPGITGGEANGSTSVTVITDSPSGYSLSIAASDNPAMQSVTDTILDYDTSGAADFTFSVPPEEARFGFTPSGSDIVDRYLDDGGVCGVGTFDAGGTCWDGLSTSPQIVSQSSTANHPLGTPTVFDFRVGVSANALVPPGTYVATTTITAIPL